MSELQGYKLAFWVLMLTGVASIGIIKYQTREGIKMQAKIEQLERILGK